MTLSFKTLRDANASRQTEWDSGNVIDLAYRGNELAGEVGEVCNVIKNLDHERDARRCFTIVADLAQELADVIICADVIAHIAGIDLGKAVAEKFNATSEKVGLATIIMLPGIDYLAEAKAEQQRLYDADNFGAAVSDHYQVGVTVPLKDVESLRHAVDAHGEYGNDASWDELLDAANAITDPEASR